MRGKLRAVRVGIGSPRPDGHIGVIKSQDDAAGWGQEAGTFLCDSATLDIDHGCFI